MTDFFKLLTCLVRDLIVLADLILETDLLSSESFLVLPFFCGQHLAGCPFLPHVWHSLSAKYSLLKLHSVPVAGVPAPFCYWTNAVPWAATGAGPSMINGLKSFMSVRAA